MNTEVVAFAHRGGAYHPEIEGLENTPQALIGLLAGENRGKRMVKL